MNIEKQYLELLRDILDNGTKKGDRTGTGTISVFGRQIRHKMSEGFPLLTTKKMYTKGIISELLWFMQGRTDLRWLLENDNKIWVGDAYQSYCKRYWDLDERDKIEYGSSYYNHETNEYEFETYSKEEFVDYIKTDDEFSKKWGDLGPIYGRQWRFWKSEAKQVLRGDGSYNLRYGAIDQLQNSIDRLLTNPDCRRNIVTAWRPDQMKEMVLPPCHYGFQFYTRELSLVEMIRLAKYENEEELINNRKDNINEISERLLKDNIPTRAISLMWNQRSVDTPLGLPFNIASYALLLELVGKMVNMVPDELIGNLGDVHIYQNQVEGVKEQLSREPYSLPKLNINTEFWPTKTGEYGIGEIDALKVLESFSDDNFCKSLMEEDIQISNYQCHPTIKFPLSN